MTRRWGEGEGSELGDGLVSQLLCTPCLHDWICVKLSLNPSPPPATAAISHQQLDILSWSTDVAVAEEIISSAAPAQQKPALTVKWAHDF